MSPKRDRTSEGDPQKGTPAHPDKTEAEAAESAEAAGQERAEERAAAGGRKPEPSAQADAEATEEKPKRARRARAKAEKRQQGEDLSAEEEAAIDEEGDADEEATERPKRRRGSAETTTGASRPARRSPDGDVTVRARARYVRTAPRKARLVVGHIRGKPVDEARAILAATPRAASKDVLKLLDSCVANAENNHELDPDELRVGQAFVDEGPTIKRYRPRALGRATRINKRTSHMTITLVPK